MKSGWIVVFYMVLAFYWLKVDNFTEKDDIFVHYSAINQEGYKTLQEGQIVEFTLLETSKGYQALNVTVVKDKIIA